MPVQHASKIAQYKVPNLPEAGPNVFFGGDALALQPDVPNRALTHRHPRNIPTTNLGFWSKVYQQRPKLLLLLVGQERTTDITPGELSIEDETGQKVHLTAGDVFFISEGSTVTFSTPKFALAYKTSNRAHSKL
ncbi:hypothetical protein HRR90_007438 [Exophiala dermatitidis]|uniref:(S)-ureidoglycine aminohydrolase cupin domain-containing protein n=1 Tax=Exophiala dermatitidis TaxID=5970 RepID=A0AAN6EQD5_EXODE|nr:hypothetical protein HRR77_007228 [Exophiala dermatitidis]KAJ4539928.1 hypothetical protein HRR76_003354 [Exophiala dermatitidis]KAJ4562483.1 hypothetical protein HRR79_006804 [Exophiala dermatitidis]KAJ4577550.1 hypothetical protein HRR82_005422 [Exophiala dermatitidis]KAJ4597593.1 hypothetical protein HRR84_004354 [Exophiala dermatitidis]